MAFYLCTHDIADHGQKPPQQIQLAAMFVSIIQAIALLHL